MDKRTLIKIKEVVNPFLEELPTTNDVVTFVDEDRVISISLCQCAKCDVINIIVQNKDIK